MTLLPNDGNAYLYAVNDPSRPRLLARLAAGDAATSVAFNADGTILAISSAAQDNVRLWDIRKPGTPTRIGQPLDGPVADIYQIVFNPARDELAAGSVDGVIWFWDLTDPHRPERKAAVTAPSAVLAVGYSRDGTTLAAGTRDEKVHIWRTDPEATIRWICAATGDHITEAEWHQLLPHAAYTPAC
jgi:WD40 repeat protein